MAPPPRASIDGTAARTIRSVLKSSRSTASCQAASSNDSAAPDGGPPALAKSRSTPPKRSSVALAQRSMPSAERTSSGVASTCPAPSRFAAAQIAASSRDAIDTNAPSAASACATAKPRPRLAPATIATFPFNPKSMPPRICNCNK